MSDLKKIHIVQVGDTITSISKLYSIKKSLSLLIEICGDKPVDSYNIDDANSFKNYFIKIDKISTGKRNQSNLKNFFSVIFQKYLIDKKNPFAGLKWPNIVVKTSHQKFSDEELIRELGINT